MNQSVAKGRAEQDVEANGAAIPVSRDITFNQAAPQLDLVVRRSTNSESCRLVATVNFKSGFVPLAETRLVDCAILPRRVSAEVEELEKFSGVDSGD